jgi:hypothetical protein
MPDVAATFRPRLSGSGAFIDNLTPVTLREEFIGGTSEILFTTDEQANIGENGWSFVDNGIAGGELAIQASTAEMLGWYKLRAEAASITGVYLGARLTPASAPVVQGAVLVDQIGYWEWRGTFNGPAITNPDDGATRFGVGQNVLVDELGSDALYFGVAPAVSEFILTCSRAGGVSTIRETTIRWVAEQVYDLRCVRVSATRFEYFIDGTLRSEHDTADGTIVPAPGTPLGFMAQSVGGAGLLAELGLDRFTFQRA